MNNESYPPLASPAPEDSVPVAVAMPIAVAERAPPLPSLFERFKRFQVEFDAHDPTEANDSRYLYSTQGANQFACTNYKTMVEELYTEWSTSKNPEIAKQLFALIFVFYYRTRDRTNYETPENPKYYEECLNVTCKDKTLISLTTYTINGVCNWMIPDRNWQPFITSFNVISEMQGENRDKFASYFNEANSLMPGKQYFYLYNRNNILAELPNFPQQTASQIYRLLTTPWVNHPLHPIISILTSYDDFLKIVAQQRAECKRGKGMGADIAAIFNKPSKGGSKRKTRRRQKKRKTRRRKTRR
jgi:hypothetical protein